MPLRTAVRNAVRNAVKARSDNELTIQKTYKHGINDLAIFILMQSKSWQVDTQQESALRDLEKVHQLNV